MSEETKAICRSIILEARKSKTLDELVDALEIIAGVQNVAEVDGMLEAQKKRKE